MFQDARLLPWKRVRRQRRRSACRADARERAREALAQVGLADRADDWPAVLSGGQRQRVALARALVHAPRLLLLDEPLGALDALTRIEMHRLIESLWQRHGFTALLVTHDVAEAVALADRVVLIEDDRIALDERVALARPRQRGPAFAAIEERVLARVLGTPAHQESAPPPRRRGRRNGSGRTERRRRRGSGRCRHARARRQRRFHRRAIERRGEGLDEVVDVGAQEAAASNRQLGQVDGEQVAGVDRVQVGVACLVEGDRGDDADARGRARRRS